MSRLILFSLAVVALSWLAMMAVHELGHVLGALVTGGTVQRVVLHPLAISRTDVAPNPHPALVVWLGPVTGCLLPLLLVLIVPARNAAMHKLACFFAGFCLIANGAYITVGSFFAMGDAGQMLRTGTPVWVMWLFGAVTVTAGLVLWHRLGSIRHLLAHPEAITADMVRWTCGVLLVVVIIALSFSPR